VREVSIETSWKEKLATEFAAEYMADLSQFLRDEKAAGKVIYPAGVDIFSAFNLTPFNTVKVIILGQDPYHGPNQAHGLSFSVRHGIFPPPSLQNIYKEMSSDLGTHPPAHGNLENWAKQGVLMLNSVLTVEHGKAGSHIGKGWERFTDAAINQLNSACDNLVFVLWGKKAQQKGSRVDPYRHRIIMSAHPSPLSAYNGFFGSKPFSKANDYLLNHNISPINWSL
jgi:uracil-DNA glycosylase